MPRVLHRKARKDYPAAGIVKGDMYYHARLKTGPASGIVLRQLKPFRRSQLTRSSFLGSLYDIEDDQTEAQCVEDCRSLAERYTNLGAECQESLDNMPENLQETDTGQLLTERIEACEAAAEEIESAFGEIDDEEKPTDDELEALLEVVQQVSAEV